MTAPEKITVKTDILHEQGGSVNLEYLVTPREIFEGEYTRSDLYEAAQARIKQLESQLALAKIASEPVYSRRQLEDENARLKSQIKKLKVVLKEYRAIVGGKDETK